jgi:hypothetical protein
MPFGASETKRGPTLPQQNFSRLRLIWSQLLDQLKMPPAPGRIVIYPRIRNFVRDVLAEGRRKNIAHLTLEADIGPMRERLAEHRRRGAEPVSITSYVAKTFACAIDEDKRMQAYRLGKSRLVLFDDVDLVFMIEREWEGEPIPVFSIVRAAQSKATHEIHRELQMAKEAPLGTDGPMNALEMQFFLLPSFLRRVLWFQMRSGGELIWASERDSGALLAFDRSGPVTRVSTEGLRAFAPANSRVFWLSKNDVLVASDLSGTATRTEPLPQAFEVGTMACCANALWFSVTNGLLMIDLVSLQMRSRLAAPEGPVPHLMCKDGKLAGGSGTIFVLNPMTDMAIHTIGVQAQSPLRGIAATATKIWALESAGLLVHIADFF